MISSAFVIALLSSCSSGVDIGSVNNVAKVSVVSQDDYLNTVDLKTQATSYAKALQEKERIAKLAVEKAKKAESDAKAEEARLAIVQQKEELRVAEEVLAQQKIVEENASVNIPAQIPSLSQNEQPVAPSVNPAPPIVPQPVIPSGVNIHVGVAGNQATIDSCIGPVLFTGAPYPYVAEHDSCGGWARFGSLSPGMQVNLTGLLNGSYTVGNVIRIPQGSMSDVLAPLGSPKVVLQTCIPGTSDMIAVGLV